MGAVNSATTGGIKLVQVASLHGTVAELCKALDGFTKGTGKNVENKFWQTINLTDELKNMYDNSFDDKVTPEFHKLKNLADDFNVEIKLKSSL